MTIIPNWHPFLVHFTIALLMISTLFYVAARLCKGCAYRDQWLMAANWNLWLGTGITVLTVLAGWYAFNTVTHDDPSHLAMIEHRNLALATFAVFIVLALSSWVWHRAGKPLPLSFLLGMVLATGLLGITGWHGAELVYRYGLGVMSLPKPEEHAHDNGADHAHAPGDIPDASGAVEKKMLRDDDHSHGKGGDDHGQDEISDLDVPGTPVPADRDHDDDHAHDHEH